MRVPDATDGSTAIEPLCNSTLFWTIDSPSPLPRDRVVKNGRKMRVVVGHRNAGTVVADGHVQRPGACFDT